MFKIILWLATACYFLRAIRRTDWERRDGRATAQVIAALSIGGTVVARTLVDRAYADELRGACLAAALELGGWFKDACSARGRLRRARSDMRLGKEAGSKAVAGV